MTKDKKQYRILVVEDNQGDFVIVEDLLMEKILNPVIVQAVNFKQASQFLLAANNSFDIILLDLSLPDKSGEALIGEMMTVAASCPVIILTGNDNIDFSIKSIAKGVYDYLLKDDLNATILYKSVVYAIERKKTISAVKESERKLKEAQAIALISNWEINLETNTHQWSEEFYDIMRIKKEEVNPSAEAFLSLLHPDDVEQAKKSMQNTFDTFQQSFFYSRINTNDGIVRFVYSEWKFEYDKTNKPIRLYGILQDVTERKIAEEKLNKSNRLYAFISAINHSIVHIKEEEELLKKACSIAMEIGSFKVAWIGLLNEEVKLEVINVLGERAAVQVVNNRSWIDVQNSPFQNTGVGKALRTGVYALSNDVLTDPDMHFFTDELLSTGIRANIVFPIKKSGKVTGVFSFNSDTVNFFDEAEIMLLQEATNNISFAIENFEKAEKHNKAEEEIKTLNKDLEKRVIERTEKLLIANKELEQFAYVASHDLQEPLRTVSNYMNVFEEDYIDLLDENAVKYIHSVNKATKRMSGLIKSLLDFSRLGHNTQLSYVDCKKLIIEVLADLDTAIQTSGATIEISEMPWLNVYETEMRLVFQNLISNAIKFRKKDTRPRIKISSAKTTTGWKISLADNGIGIDMEHYHQVFEIFQRLETKEKYEGSGIGLAKCKKIIQLHRGEIWIESNPAQGSTFHFTIPTII